MTQPTDHSALYNQFALDAAAAAELEDQTQDVVIVSRTIPAGKAFARLVSYIELGMQPQTFEGKPAKDAEEIQLVFELHNPTWNAEAGYNWTDDAGVVHPTRMTMTVTKKKNERSRFRKLMNKLMAAQPAGSIKHMSQLIGQGYLVEIHHDVSKKDENKKFPNLWSKADGNYSINPAAVFDPTTGGVINLKIPAPQSAPQLFIFEKPNKLQWSSIFIDGEYEKENADKTKTKVSKNKIQEKILKATNFRGSAVEAFLNGSAETIAQITAMHTSMANEAAAEAVSVPATAAVPQNPVQTIVEAAQEVATQLPLTAATQAATPAVEPTVAPAVAQTATSTVSPAATGNVPAHTVEATAPAAQAAPTKASVDATAAALAELFPNG